MERTTQLLSQKISLPIKTKIAAWWSIIFGGILLIQITREILGLVETHSLYLTFDIIAEELFLAILIFTSSIFLLFRRRAAWWVLRIFLWIVLIVGAISSLIVAFDIHIPIPWVIMDEIESLTIDSVKMLVPMTLYKLPVPRLVIDLIPLIIIFIPLILLEVDRKNFNDIVKKTRLLLKTEVAYFLIGIDLLFLFIYTLYNQFCLPEYGVTFFYGLLFIVTSTIFLPLLKRKRWAWKISVAILGLLSCFYLFMLITNGNMATDVPEILLGFLLIFPSFILFLLDRKNFFRTFDTAS